jgi:holo-[acyl-carrier protein] synthase
MIIRTGVDLVHIERLEKIQPTIRARFLQRVYTPGELVQARDENETLAGFFAVKEAVSKALGTGIGRVSWKEIEVSSKPSGEPVLLLHGNARTRSEQLGLQSWAISISHSRGIAVATAMAIGEG